VVFVDPSVMSSRTIIGVWVLALGFSCLVLLNLRREQRAGEVVEQPDRITSDGAHPGRQRPARRPVPVAVHGQRGVAVVCAHLEKANNVGAVAAVCGIVLVVVLDPLKFHEGWAVPLSDLRGHHLYNIAVAVAGTT
jgi:hypothetical protein